jgi:hypothetical protein
MLKRNSQIFILFLSLTALGLLFSNSALAQGASLENQPQTEIREMSTDRPDKTESAYTVARSYVQLEMDFASYHYDKSANSKLESWNLLPINLKFGILDNVDIQFIFDGYIL